MAKIVRIGVAGLGTVGAQTVRLLRERSPEFARRLGSEPRVEAVCDHRAKAEARALAFKGRLYTDPLRLAADPNLDIIVEAIGGLKDARALVLAALKNGKHVVTANKRLLAHHGEELFEAARRSRRRLFFEASVAGGIPILQAIGQSLAANRIRRVLGILNGTTNFILTRMIHDGLRLEEALVAAQRLGLAERDPGMDLRGTDAAHKAAIIASLVTGGWLKPGSVAHAGINALQPEDIRFAVKSLKRTPRLLGVVEVDWDSKPVGVSAHVHPTLIPLEHPLAAVHDEYNAVLLEASAAGELMFYGKGAGAGPAASAVVGDIFMLSQQLGASHPQLENEFRPIRLMPFERTRCPFYLRLSVLDRAGVLSRITGILGKNGISIAQIHQEARSGSGRASVFLATHPASQRQMDRACGAILALREVSKAHTQLRML